MSISYFSVELEIFNTEISESLKTAALPAIPKPVLEAEWDRFLENLINDGFSEEYPYSDETRIIAFFEVWSLAVPNALFVIRFLNLGDMEFGGALVANGRSQIEMEYIDPERRPVEDEAGLRHGICFQNEEIRDLFRFHGFRACFTPVGLGENGSVYGTLSLTADGGIDRLECRPRSITAQTAVVLEDVSKGYSSIAQQADCVTEITYSFFGEEDFQLISDLMKIKLENFVKGNLPVFDDTDWKAVGYFDKPLL